MRGIKTLPLRMKAHAENAMAVALWLERQPKVERVVYPGLPSHPQHELAKSQMHGFGGMVTFFLRGGMRESRQFLSNVQMIALAESLGEFCDALRWGGRRHFCYCRCSSC